ncbi:NAD(P)-dependent oxidoreductase [uncultured Methylobacterium sp.]|uniref:NAD(P)-dependent oxidoreductase n=1 Tax=uncultured Methylobacterium sp. TaxID=157278 RepID=UPI0035CA8725
MKIVVFGSTGGTGIATLRALVAVGHEVTGFARDPTKLPPSPSIRSVQGDVMNASDVASAMPGHDLVIVSLGNSQNPFALMLGARRTTPANVCEIGTRNIVTAMQATRTARLLVVTAFGIGDTKARLPFAFKMFYRTVLREHMADKEKQEDIVKASGLDWTLVQPVGLTDGPAINSWLADTQGMIRRQQISRADVAAFLVSLVSSDEYSRVTVALSG